MTRREQIALSILAEFGSHGIERTNAGKLVADCPGKRHHTGPNNKRDFELHLDGAPTGTCFHHSCDAEVAAFNLRLRQEIGKDEGTKPESHGYALDWDSIIGPAVPHVDGKFVDAVDLPSPARSPAEDLALYLSTLFDPSDVVAYTTDAAQLEGSTKWTPQGRGTYVRTAGDILTALRTLPVDLALNATLNPEAGAWFRLNPFDGAGIADANVADFRHALVESDGMPLERQLALMKELNIPCACVVHSGAKSLHAVVRIDAGKDRDLYRKRVNDLYDVLEKNGFKVDSQNRNPGRLSRMPGVDRAGARQYLLAVNMGAKNWQAWEDWRNEYDDKLPAFEGMQWLLSDPPPLAPVLIDGVLRQGHKLLLSGPSKAGKSFALIQLCVAISNGSKWLGMPCQAGRVLYVNMELDRASCVKRFADVCQQLALPAALVDVWNMRGHRPPGGLAEVVPKLVRRMAATKYAAVVIDPIYKLLTGDENSNSDMALFCGYLDQIAMLTGSSVVVASHFSKGAQGAKSAMDRTAGAGVFARDPDAILTLTEIEAEDQNMGAPYRLEFTLREFARPAPIDLFFRYPLHVMDDAGAVAGKRLHGAGGRPPKNEGNSLILALNALDLSGVESPSVARVTEQHNVVCREPVSDRTIRRRAQELVPDRDGWRFDGSNFWKVD
jgi:RecA-family ATPase